MIESLPLNYTEHDIVNFVKERMKEIGVNTSDCTAYNIVKVFGKEYEQNQEVDAKLYVTYYVHSLAIATLQGKYGYLPRQIRKQLKRAFNDGVICVYLSTVFQMLMKIFCPESQCDLYLGYIDGQWDFSNDFLPIEIPTMKVLGFHAIPVVDGYIIDVCYPYQYEGMDKLDSFIIGKYDTDVAMYGWRMNSSSSSLINKFARYSHSTPVGFKYTHVHAFREVINNDTKKASN